MNVWVTQGCPRWLPGSGGFSGCAWARGQRDALVGGQCILSHQENRSKWRGDTKEKAAPLRSEGRPQCAIL